MKLNRFRISPNETPSALYRFIADWLLRQAFGRRMDRARTGESLKLWKVAAFATTLSKAAGRKRTKLGQTWTMALLDQGVTTGRP